MLIQITANVTRTATQTGVLCAAIARILAVDPGVRPENVLVSLVEVSAETSSFGNGGMKYGLAA